MTSVEVTEIANNIDEVLDRMKKGEQVVVTQNGVVVAELTPTAARRDESEDEKLTRLEKAGIIRRGRGSVPRWLIDEPPPKAKGGASIVDAVLDERNSSNGELAGKSRAAAFRRFAEVS